MPMINDDNKVDALRLEGISIRFGALVAVEDVSLQVAAGQRHVLLGSNGAGKTTLFNCIAGDIRASSGRISMFGRDVTRVLTHRRVRQGLRRTYQTSRLFDGLSVIDNLMIAVQGVQPRRFGVQKIGNGDPRQAEAKALALRLGLEQDLDRAVSALSHGQRRQLELGMALAGAARLLLLDEPAAGLSGKERTALLEMLKALPKDQTLVMIEHDIDIAMQIADRITVMHQGRIIAAGSPAEIAANETVLEIYLGRHGH